MVLLFIATAQLCGAPDPRARRGFACRSAGALINIESTFFLSQVLTMRFSTVGAPGRVVKLYCNPLKLFTALQPQVLCVSVGLACHRMNQNCCVSTIAVSQVKDPPAPLAHSLCGCLLWTILR